MSVGGFWIILVVTGVVASLLGFIAWRLKRRRLAEIVCASCQRSVPVDVLDEKTDGFFCPHCGASGMWKGRRVDVDVTRL
jgi:DNA-directed RNA polymerase subunit RPC12/RpoP